MSFFASPHEDTDAFLSRLNFVSSAVLSIVGGEVDVNADADLHELLCFA